MNRIFAVLAVVWASLFISFVQAEPAYTEEGSKLCLSCHDFGDGSPVHPMLASKHGQSSDGDTPMAGKGCETCHGPSKSHSQAPTRVAPAVSFGPRWTASADQQNSQCIECHEQDAAKLWGDGVHQQQQLTCVTCHDLHTEADTVLADQSAVCTTCHKTQKEGIHNLHDKLANNPQCTDCHDAHGDPKPMVRLLENRSEGCRTCHDLVKMASDPAASPRAVSYHKTMVQPGRSCIDCHQGIAHAAADSAAPVIRQAQSQMDVTLFYPGQSDGDWLLAEHAGAQSFRQGRNCQQCHRGEESAMGESLAPSGLAATRKISVSFGQRGQQTVVRLAWQGDKADKDIAVMWSGSGSYEAQRSGCWAACHSDMPGMSRDRGQQQGKYLAASRAQMQRIGLPPQIKSQSELDAMQAAGNYIDIQRVVLTGQAAKLDSGQILDALSWQKQGDELTASYVEGRWQVELPVPVGKGQRSFGIALHGAGGEGAGHWVSLPMSFAPEGKDTEFRLP